MVICDYCGEEIESAASVKYNNRILHKECYTIELMKLQDKQIQTTNKQISQIMKEIESLSNELCKINKLLDTIIEKQDIHFDTQKLSIDYAKEISSQLIILEENRIGNLFIEINKILLWLEMKGATKNDIRSDELGIFDPLLLELFKKYSGMEWAELSRIIKNKGMKDLINKLKKEERQK